MFNAGILSKEKFDEKMAALNSEMEDILAMILDARRVAPDFQGFIL